jgi:hypothetical protein
MNDAGKQGLVVALDLAMKFQSLAKTKGVNTERLMMAAFLLAVECGQELHLTRQEFEECQARALNAIAYKDVPNA